MIDDTARRIRELFWRASELPGEDRLRYLDEACAGDAEVRSEVESLLAARVAGAEFLELPAVEAHRGWFDAGDRFDRHAVPERIGDYRVLRRLGGGGMGEVYLAEQERPIRRKVALKVIKLGMDTREVISRFHSEREALARMSHSNIARVYDAGATSAGRPFFVMEYVPGAPMTSYCDERRMTIRERLRVYIDVCNAVQHAHQKAIIHRDIKPSNVLVTGEDSRSVPKVIDFGVSKAIDQHGVQRTLITEQGRLVGTPEYMSPEQAGGDPLDIDTRTDVYSLGVLLYELLVGSLPYDPGRLRGVLPSEVQRILVEEEPPRPSSRLRNLDRSLALERARARGGDVDDVVRQVSGDLDWIVSKAIDKKPDRRYVTPADLAADVRRFLEYDPVLATPPSISYRLEKLVHRHRALVATLVAVVMGLSVGLALAVWQYLVADTARVAAEQAGRREAERAAELERAVAAERLAFAKERDALDQLMGSVLTARSLILVESDPSEALEVAIEGERRHSTLEARNAVLSSLEELTPYVELRGHTGRVPTAAFSPDGKRVASGSLDDGTVRIWDAESGAESHELSHPRVIGVEFHPEGRWLVSCGTRSVKVWDAPRGLCVATLRAHGSGATFSPDGELIAISSYDGPVLIWRWSSQKKARVFCGHTGRVELADFDATGRRVVTPSWDSTVRVWSIDSGEALILRGHMKQVNCARFSPSGDRIASASHDGARIWDAAAGHVLHVLPTDGARLVRVAFSPDGSLVAAGGGYGTVLLWRARTGEPVHRISTHGGDPVRSLVFDREGARLLTGGADGTARLVDVVSGDEIAAFRGHRKHIETAAFGFEDRHIVTASFDHTVRVWEARTVGQSLTIPRVVSASSLDTSPDGRFLLTAGEDRSARVWSLETRELAAELSSPAEVISAVFGPRGRRVLTLSASGRARIWSWQTGTIVGEIGDERGGLIRAEFCAGGERILTTARGPRRLWSVSGKEIACFREAGKHSEFNGHSSDGTRFAIPWSDDTVRIFDAMSGEASLTLSGHAGEVYRAEFSPDDRLVATASREGTARVWNATSGDSLAQLRHANRVWSVAFDPHGRRLATASWDHTARVWEVGTWKLLAELSGHEGYLHNVAFSRDGLRLATTSGDLTARIWDASSGEELLTLRHTARPRLAAFSRGGDLLITVTSHGTARLWPVDPTSFAARLGRGRPAPDEVAE